MKTKLSSEERIILKELQKAVKERWKYIRITVILMLDNECSVKEICEHLGIDENTIYTYAQTYKDLGIDGLLDRNYKGYSGKLNSSQIQKLEKELESKLYTNTKEICKWIKSNLNVEYTEEGLVKLLHRIGFSYKKTKQIPCEANAEEQKKFLEDLKPILEEKDSAVYYTDGVHPTHNTRSMYGWIRKGQEFELKTVSGRDRVNINGALNAKDVTDVITRIDDSINAQSTIELYKQILEANPDKKKIYVISDNARYYKNKDLKEWLKGTKIVQIFLPTYSPNLNLIERLWKFLRKKIIDPIFYRKKDEFEKGIVSFFKNISQYKEDLRSLLTLNFKVINS